MKERRGFTIVEVMIVIIIMGILLVIGTVLFRGYQSNARDKEREADVAAIQAYLESIYPMELRAGLKENGDVVKPAGAYPTTTDSGYQEVIFKDLDAASLTPPGADSRLKVPTLQPVVPSPSDVATIKDKYVYTPGAGGRSYTLSYVTEVGGETLKKVESKRR